MNATLPNPLTLAYKRPPHPDNLFKDVGEIQYWYSTANQSDPAYKLMRRSFEEFATVELEEFCASIAEHRAARLPDADVATLAVAFAEKIVAMHDEAIRGMRKGR